MSEKFARPTVAGESSRSWWVVGLLALCVLSSLQVVSVWYGSSGQDGETTSNARVSLLGAWRHFTVLRDSPLKLPTDTEGGAHTTVDDAAGLHNLRFLAESPLDNDLGNGIAEDIAALEELGSLVEMLAGEVLASADAPLFPASEEAPDDGATVDKKPKPRIDIAQFAALLCNDVHPNAESPDMLHVVYAFNLQQLVGFQASVASLISSSDSLEMLTIHIIVQEQLVNELKITFGIAQHCASTVFDSGFMLTIHVVDKSLIAKAMAKVPEKVKQKRGAIDSVENFARFYMDLIVGWITVVYLDTDTIVQKDLGVLRRQLSDSKRTAGFVSRDGVRMEEFLRSPKSCKDDAKPFHRIAKQPAFNVGVFAVNLKRWAEKRYAEKVESWVDLHNRCGGKLWIGGSQPPLLLSFYIRPEGQPEDFILFEKGWNAGDLGWRQDMDVEKLSRKNLLHWNGDRKPWREDGLYTKLWVPHHERFDALMRPHEAAKDCPNVELYDAWVLRDQATCEMGKTYGCSSYGAGMWTSGGCKGLFRVSGMLTVCGTRVRYKTPYCNPGRLIKPKAACNMQILTSFFTAKKDWQRKKYAEASYKKIQTFYRSTMELGLNVTVIYDQLPDVLLTKFSSSRFSFVKVNLGDFNKQLGVNDVRYYFFDRILNNNPSWQYIFVMDAFDAKVVLNPCLSLRPDTLYVGSELEPLKKHPWMKARFKELGGKYLRWYKSVDENAKILNCGITGGDRSVMKKLFSSMKEIQNEVLSDPNSVIKRKNNGEIEVNVNMPALNYIAYTDFAGKIITNAPVHSEYKRYQNSRMDVWFIHK